MAEDHEDGQELQIVVQEAPGTKYYTANELESEAEREERYLEEFWPIYERIVSVGAAEDASEIPDDHVQEPTDYNIDPNC